MQFQIIIIKKPEENNKKYMYVFKKFLFDPCKSLHPSMA